VASDLAYQDGHAVERRPQPLLRRTDASRYLAQTWGIGRSPATLAKYAVMGGGPLFYKAGRWPLYSAVDLDAWAQELIGEPVRSTAHATARKAPVTGRPQ
jgi:hypothetical protein